MKTLRYIVRKQVNKIGIAQYVLYREDYMDHITAVSFYHAEFAVADLRRKIKKLEKDGFIVELEANEVEG